MANFTFTNAYLEGITGQDLDNSGSIGSGTIPSGLAGYSSGDNFIATGKLASVASLNAVKAYFDTLESAYGFSFDGSYIYEELEDTAANLSNVSSVDIGNISTTLTITDSRTSPADISTLQSIKTNYGGTNFNYDGIKGTVKELADSRSGAFDWITNIKAVSGLKHATLTDLSASPDYLKTLVTGLNSSDYEFKITGLTHSVGNESFVGTVDGDSLAYRSDSTPDATTSYAEGAQSFVSGDYTVTAIGFLNQVPGSGDLPFSHFNIASDDISSNVSLKVNFYSGEQLSHVNISGATLSTTTGYKYSQTAGSGTDSITDDIWTLELKLDAGQPAKTTSVSDNTGAEVIGVMINSVSAEKVGGNSDYGASVFRTNAFWEDIDLMSSSFKFSDLSPGFLVDGTNGEEVDFDFHFTKDYLERTFSTDFDSVAGGFVGTALSTVDESNDHTGSYIDVSKNGSISALRLPVDITDVSSTTAGGLTDFYQVAFQNDSWSVANLALVYGPAQNAAPVVAVGGGADAYPAFEGNDSDQKFWGGVLADVLKGLGGDDWLYGEQGNDQMYGGKGQDHLFGGTGNDLIYGGKGNDRLIGNQGRDTLYGNRGGDLLFGWEDDDFIRAGKGPDVMSGGSGRDEIWGDFGMNLFLSAKDFESDLLVILSDQFLINENYGTAGNNANGEKADVISELDPIDLIKIHGVSSNRLSFADTSINGMSGIGIYADSYLEALYIGSDLSLGQIQVMTSGVSLLDIILNSIDRYGSW